MGRNNKVRALNDGEGASKTADLVDVREQHGYTPWYFHLPEPGKGYEDYNHSSYCDLIITGLVGLRPREDDIIEVNPLVPADRWDWFCLDNVPYHGKTLTILWDKTGDRYGMGQGFRVFVDGKQIAQHDKLGHIQQ